MSSLLGSELIENTVYSEISVGKSARLVRTLALDDIAAFAAVSGDANPSYLEPDFAGASSLHEVIGHGMWGGALISAVLGAIFPGPGTVYLSQTLTFEKPIKVGDTVTILVTVVSKNDQDQSVLLDCVALNQRQERVVTGEARVLAPTVKIKREKTTAPRIQLFDPEARTRNLLARGSGLEAIRCGVVHPCDEGSLLGAIEAAENNLIEPILIGPEAKIRQCAERFGININSIEIIPAPHSHAAADLAATMAASGRFEALMKGSLHTDELMHAVINQAGLRTKRRLSHIFRFEVPLYQKPLLISDAALNIKPGLQEKVDIVQNAIHLSEILGLVNPRVALLSAVETITPAIASTIDAAALCKMADRGQITGGILDGPLAFDNAISLEAARIKQIQSPVAGQADILIVPDLESGNMLAKQLEYLAGGIGAGIVMGARMPIALTSRADGPLTRIASALLAKLVAHHYRAHKP